MARWFSLLLVSLAAISSGCAAQEARLAQLESDVAALQAGQIRIAILEDAVNRIAGQGGEIIQSTGQASRPAHPVSPVHPEKGPVYVPRKVESAVTPGNTTSSKAPAKRSSAAASQEYRRALSMLEGGRPTTAMGLFETFLQTRPNDPLAPNAGYWLGECHYSLKQYATAATAFKDVVAQYPAHPKAADSMLKAGYSYLQMGDRASARNYFETLIRQYPGSRSASLAQQRLASL